MELKDFVKHTLAQISEGVNEAQGSVRDAGGYVNPAAYRSHRAPDSSHFASMGNGVNVFLIDFDVAVTVNEETTGDLKAKLSVASLVSMGGGSSSEHGRSATNRISFKVPIALPVDPVTEAELKEREAERKRNEPKPVFDTF